MYINIRLTQNSQICTPTYKKAHSNMVSGWRLVASYVIDSSILHDQISWNITKIYVANRMTFASISALLYLFSSSSLQVMQVVNADAIVVKLNSGEYKTIHLSSIRPPRLEGEVRVNACLSLDLPVTEAITESTGCRLSVTLFAKCWCEGFPPLLHLLKAQISSLHASFTLWSQEQRLYWTRGGARETEAHRPSSPLLACSDTPVLHCSQKPYRSTPIMSTRSRRISLSHLLTSYASTQSSAILKCSLWFARC